MKHTKGKWEPIIERYPNDPKIIYTGVGIKNRVDGGFYIEFICNSILPDDDDEYMKQHDEIKANMKLIAAAPELLAALQQFIHSVEHEGYSGRVSQSIEDAKILIKKATE